MRRPWIVFSLLAGCAAPAPVAAPLGAGDREALQARLKTAQEAPFVLGRFYGEYEVDGKVLTRFRGTSRAYRSGVVLIEEEAAFGAPLRMLRVGDRAWIYEDGWRDAAGTPWAAAGTGFQNPVEVLDVLESAADAFTPHRQGGVECSDGRNRALLGPLTDRAKAHPPETSAIHGVLKDGFREGALITRFSAENGASTVWIAKLDVVSWGAAPPMRFDDIPAPFSPDMRAAVRKAEQSKGK